MSKYQSLNECREQVVEGSIRRLSLIVALFSNRDNRAINSSHSLRYNTNKRNVDNKILNNIDLVTWSVAQIILIGDLSLLVMKLQGGFALLILIQGGDEFL